MATVRDFEDLGIFQKARELSKKIYPVTQRGEFKNDFRFVQQIRAAAGSIMDNIAEGFERTGNKEFLNFLYIAKGSCGEVRSQLIRANDVGYLTPEEYEELYIECQAFCCNYEFHQRNQSKRHYRSEVQALNS